MSHSKPSTILAVGAHPDDLEFGCGAVLLKEVDAGNSIVIALTSQGEAASNGDPEIRKQETLAAAKLLGADSSLHYLDFGGDGKQQETPENAILLARLIREHRPQYVLAPLPVENQHPDHCVTGKVARTACRLARYGGLAELKNFPSHKMDALWFYAVTPDPKPMENASVYIDISATYERWIKLMECHQSQVQSRQYIELQTTRARELGLRSNCEYALELWPNDPPVIDRLTHLRKSARAY